MTYEAPRRLLFFCVFLLEGEPRRRGRADLAPDLVLLPFTETLSPFPFPLYTTPEQQISPRNKGHLLLFNKTTTITT